MTSPGSGWPKVIDREWLFERNEPGKPKYQYGQTRLVRPRVEVRPTTLSEAEIEELAVAIRAHRDPDSGFPATDPVWIGAARYAAQALGMKLPNQEEDDRG